LSDSNGTLSLTFSNFRSQKNRLQMALPVVFTGMRFRIFSTSTLLRNNERTSSHTQIMRHFVRVNSQMAEIIKLKINFTSPSTSNISIEFIFHFTMLCDFHRKKNCIFGLIYRLENFRLLPFPISFLVHTKMYY
jgi:hypothetical protein